MSPDPGQSAPVSTPRLYVIADVDALGARDPAAVVADLADVGVRWLQIRAKKLHDLELWNLCERCMRAVEGSESLLWINDRADVAAILGAPGLHLGQEDLPPAAARRVLPKGVLLGRSTHDVSQFEVAAGDDSVDVIAVGPVFGTRSKDNPDPTVGLDLLRQVRALSTKPIVAIGGIDEARATSVLEAGADSVAVISAVCGAPDPKAAAGRLLRLLG